MRPWVVLVVLAAGCGATGPGPEASDPCAREVAARDDHIAALLAPSLASGGHPYLDMTEAGDRAAALVTRLGSCADAPELARLSRFARALAATADPERSLGLRITDRTYLDRHRQALALPPLLSDPTFLDHMRDPSGYAEAMAMIDARNASVPAAERWTTLLYQSRFLTTPDDTTHGRLLVLVPGPPDLWIQFGIATPDMQPPPRIHSISVVAVSFDAGPLFLDYWRVYDGDRIELSTRVESGHGGSNCYGCHKLPVLPIRPAQVFALDPSGALVPGGDAAELLAELDRRIVGYGPPAFADELAPEDWGPPLGPPERARPDAFMRRCAPDLDRAARDRVREAMRCGSCHDGSYLGRINVPQALRSGHDLSVLRHPGTGASMPMVREFVTQGWMPPARSLAGAAERTALYDCLMLEYWDPGRGTGLLADWLRGR